MTNVLITGSSSGIGLEIAHFLEGDYKVFLSSRRASKCTNHFPLDLSNAKEEDFICLIEKAKEYFNSSVDVLVNCAGQYIYKEIEKTTSEEIEYLINLNYKAPYILSKLVISDMKKNGFGRIVNIGSISSIVGEANATLYSSTKASLLGLTKALALEAAPYGITVNQISPGFVKTPLNDILSDEEKQEVIDVTPQSRFIEPIEVAQLCKYLISDSAKGITGQNINLCAGLTLGC